MGASTPKGRIQKGKALESYVAEQIKELGIDPRAHRSFGSGNTTTEKSDIWTSMLVLGRQAGIECKHADRLDIPDWWKQTKKLESFDYEPILCFKQTADTYDGTRVVIYLDTFLRLVAATKK